MTRAPITMARRRRARFPRRFRAITRSATTRCSSSSARSNSKRVRAASIGGHDDDDLPLPGNADPAAYADDAAQPDDAEPGGRAITDPVLYQLQQRTALITSTPQPLNVTQQPDQDNDAAGPARFTTSRATGNS